MGQPLADCDFNLAALHPAYPIKRRTSAERTQASPVRRHPEESPALDPLENNICAIATSPEHARTAAHEVDSGPKEKPRRSRRGPGQVGRRRPNPAGPFASHVKSRSRAGPHEGQEFHVRSDAEIELELGAGGMHPRALGTLARKATTGESRHRFDGHPEMTASV